MPNTMKLSIRQYFPLEMEMQNARKKREGNKNIQHPKSGMRVDMPKANRRSSEQAVGLEITLGNELRNSRQNGGFNPFTSNARRYTSF